MAYPLEFDELSLALGYALGVPTGGATAAPAASELPACVVVGGWFGWRSSFVRRRRVCVWAIRFDSIRSSDDSPSCPCSRVPSFPNPPILHRHHRGRQEAREGKRGDDDLSLLACCASLVGVGSISIHRPAMQLVGGFISSLDPHTTLATLPKQLIRIGRRRRRGPLRGRRRECDLPVAYALSSFPTTRHESIR
jgi:hypothetical protein